MSGFQFIHLEAYSRSGSKGCAGNPKGKTRTAQSGKQARLSIREVVDEALRRDGSCPHVPNPQPPRPILGDLEAAVSELEKRAAPAKDKLGRKLRKDKLLLLAGVASYPVPVAELDESDGRFLQWMKLTEGYLRSRWGSQLKAIVYHGDETFPHIHFYVCPDDLDMASIHPGIKASEEAPLNGSKAAYNAAMRDFQDEYYDHVAQYIGMARLGPKRRRLNRAEWRAEQAAAELTAKCLEQRDLELVEATKQLSEKRRNLLISKSALSLEKAQLEAKADRLEKKAQELKVETLRVSASSKVVAVQGVSILVHAVRQMREVKGGAKQDDASKLTRLQQELDERNREIAALRDRLENWESSVGKGSPNQFQGPC